MADTALAHRLSKSRYLAGLQCHKQLWWRVHEPDAPELVPDVALRNRFAQGAEVDQRARGYVPGGELIDLPFYECDNKVAATRDAIRHDPPVLYQPWFLADETYAGVDILTRGPRGYDVIEVKAANRLKPEHVPDVAVQVHVLRQSGLPVERAEVMHLNPECRHPDLSNLFVREDVTAAVEGVLVGLPDELAAQRRMLEGPLPDVAIGDHCTRPHDCPFLERCWPKLPDHHVSKLYRIERRQLLEYEADGYASMADLPTDLELSAIHARQVRAVRSGVMVVEPSPEFEVHILGQKDQTDSLKDYQCAGEHQASPYYFDQNDLDWSGSVMLYSKTQLDNYHAAHPAQDVRVFVVEDDDTACEIKTTNDFWQNVVNAVDGANQALTAGKDTTSSTADKAWKFAKAIQKLLAALASLINTNDELPGNAVQDNIAGEYHDGYNWVVKGEKNVTNGWIKLELR